MAGRGGYQPPRNPAPVSNPQSGRRTDGGPGSSRQPIRVPSGGVYGQRKALTEQQQAAPLPDNTGVAPSAGGGGRPAQGPSVSVANGAFGPTQRPNEPNTMMPNAQATNPAAANPQAMIRVLYSKFPHPAIARLLDVSAGGNRLPQ